MKSFTSVILVSLRFPFEILVRSDGLWWYLHCKYSTKHDLLHAVKLVLVHLMMRRKSLYVSRYAKSLLVKVRPSTKEYVRNC